MASEILRSENLQTLIVTSISPEALKNKNKKSVIIKETCYAVFGLLNSLQGGNFKLSSAQTLSPNLLDKLIRSIEQSLIEFIGLTNLSALCQVKISVCRKEITFIVKPSDRVFTVNYNLALPTNFLVREILKSEPLTNIARLLKPGPLFNSNLQNFVKVFQKDTLVCDLSDLRESDTVQFKKLKSDRNKNKSLADHIIANKVTHYVSAFANHKGGHVYIGIDDDTYRVYGQNVDDEEKQRIVERVNSAIKNMIWPEEHGEPEVGKHWDISFIPVLEESRNEIPGLFVIVISIARCPGGVFLTHPETYIIDDDKVARMEFEIWKKRVLHDSHMYDIVKFCRENDWFGAQSTTRNSPRSPETDDTGEMCASRGNADQDECATIPKSVGRIVPRNTKSAIMCLRITDAMERLIQDGNFDKVQHLSSKICCFKSKTFHKQDLEVAARFMLALGAYRRRSFTEAYQELNKASALMTSAENAVEFEIQKIHLQACFCRGEGHYSKSYEVTSGGLQRLESITPGWHSAWMLNDAGYLFSILAGEERNGEVRQSLKQQAIKLYTQAIEHAIQFGKNTKMSHTALTAKSNLLHRCHLRLAMLLLGCAPLAEKDDAFREVTYEDLDNAVVHILCVKESVMKGDSITEVNDCYLSLAKSDINYRNSQVITELGREYHKKAVEWATKAQSVAKRLRFPGILKYAQSRLDGRLAKFQCSRRSGVEDELLADLGD